MPSPAPTNIAEYIAAAPAAGQPHLRRLFEMLKSAAPDAEQVIKWGTPFFVEPRFLFAFSAHKAHLNLAATEATLAHFHAALRDYKTTRNLLQLRYDEALPEALIRQIAEHRVKAVQSRQDDSFW